MRKVLRLLKRKKTWAAIVGALVALGMGAEMADAIGDTGTGLVTIIGHLWAPAE